VGFAFFVIREGADEELSELVDENLEDGEGDGGCAVVHEDSVSHSEGNVEGLEEGNEDHKHEFSCDGEREESVNRSLRHD
jgi:F420-0:gamma-glutamyl ligase